MGLECRPQTPGQGSSPCTGLAPGPSLEASGLWTAPGLGFSQPWPAQHPAIEPRLTTMVVSSSLDKLTEMLHVPAQPSVLGPAAQGRRLGCRQMHPRKMRHHGKEASDP